MSWTLIFGVCLQCIDKARDILDTELTAMAGESYSRAYGVRCRQLLWGEMQAALMG